MNIFVGDTTALYYTCCCKLRYKYCMIIEQTIYYLVFKRLDYIVHSLLM